MLQHHVAQEYVVQNTVQNVNTLDLLMCYALKGVQMHKGNMSTNPGGTKQLQEFCSLFSKLVAYATLRRHVLHSSAGRIHAYRKRMTEVKVMCVWDLLCEGLGLCGGGGNGRKVLFIKASVKPELNPQLLLAVMELIHSLCNHVIDSSTRKCIASGLQYLSNRLARGGEATRGVLRGDMVLGEDSEEDQPGTQEQAQKREEGQRLQISQFLVFLEAHVVACVKSFGRADISLRKKVQIAYNNVELLLRTVHLDNAEAFQKSAKSVMIFSSKAVQGPLSDEEAAEIIQKRIRGIQARKRFRKLQAERRKAVMAKIRQQHDANMSAEEKAAICIQKRVRGMMHRKRFERSRSTWRTHVCE